MKALLVELQVCTKFCRESNSLAIIMVGFDEATKRHFMLVLRLRFTNYQGDSLVCPFGWKH